MTEAASHAPPASAGSAPFPRLVGARTVTVVVLFIALELCLKHFAGLGWWTVNERSERYGWRMLPNQDARSRDLSVVEHINSMGFRDREWEPPVSDGRGGWVKDEGVFRVAIVGNSMTYGTSVPIESVYTRTLEDKLQALLDARGSPRRALVMNFAVQGYSLEQMARVYEDHIRPYRPDLFVVPIHPHDAMPMGPAIDDPDYDLRTWVMRTATYDLLLKHVIDRWIPPVPPPAEARRKAQEIAALDKSLTEAPFAAVNRPLFDAAMKRLDTVLAQVEADGGRLAVMFLPRWLRHFNSKMAEDQTFWGGWLHERRERIVKVLTWPVFEQAMKPVVEEMRAKGIPLGTTHDLTTLTWTDAQGRTRRGDELDTGAQSPHLLDDLGHFTALGHGLVADELAGAISGAGLLD